MLLIQNFIKRYPGSQFPVLDIPQLNLDKNLYWLKGVNGSGKSSLIRCVAGLIPFKGSITIDGLDPKTDRMAFRRAVNHAEAEPVYPGFLTGTDLFKFYSETKKANGKQRDSLIERFEMSSYLNNRIDAYSSGMLKKLSLALSFLGNPSWILLDEPFITLDSIAVNELLLMLKESNEQGKHILIASHQEPEGIKETDASLLQIKDQHVLPLYAQTA
jgi:ABC-2 type transport system ATP-binding protein